MIKVIQKPVNFVKEVRVELGKVAWSSRQELMDATVAVIVVTGIMAIFIGLIDFILAKLLSVVFK